jgi:hypothetical protein
MTNEEINRVMEEAKYNGCGSQIALFVMLAVFLLCSCNTKNLVETETQYQHISELTSSVDSLIHTTATWQQSIFEKQTALVDSFKQSEVRDTSRVVFLDEKRDTIKEIITIKETIEREHTSQESTQEYYQELFKQTDSLFKANQVLQTKMDSILHDHNKETMVEKEVPWYQRLWDKLEVILLIILVILLVVERLGRKTIVG